MADFIEHLWEAINYPAPPFFSCLQAIEDWHEEKRRLAARLGRELGREQILEEIDAELTIHKAYKARGEYVPREHVDRLHFLGVARDAEEARLGIRSFKRGTMRKLPPADLTCKAECHQGPGGKLITISDGT